MASRKFYHRDTEAQRHSRKPLAVSLCLCVSVVNVPQSFERDFAVVEVALLGSDYLVVLVPLARDDDEVARARLFNRAMNRLAPVNDLSVRLPDGAQADFNVLKYRLGVFRARIVGRGDDHVAE